MDVEQFSRIDKIMVDSAGLSPDQSHARRAACRLDVICGPEVLTSRTARAAALTAMLCARRCFPGGVSLSATPTIRAALLAEIGDVGVTGCSDETATPAHYAIVIGTALAPSNALRVTFDGWTARVGPDAGGRLPETERCPLAGVLAGALAVSEAFLGFADIEPTAWRRKIAVSLWAPWSDAPDVGPQLALVPSRAWLIGLGHLGQAYAWAYSWLPVPKGKSELWLVDDEVIEKVNLETGLLSTSGVRGQYKTRAVSAWLERQGVRTRILERRVDAQFKVTGKEPRLLIGGVDENRVRHHLAGAGGVLVDAGLGNRADNFETIAVRTYPNERTPEELWPTVGSKNDFAERLARENPAYQNLADDECGRLRLAERSVGVPFVGSTAACFVWAHTLRLLHGGAHVSDLKVRLSDPRSLDAFHRPFSTSDVELLDCVPITSE